MAQYEAANGDLGKPQSQARVWFEPLLVVTIMLTSLYLNRDRSFGLFASRAKREDAGSFLLKEDGEDDYSSSSSRSASPDRPLSKEYAYPQQSSSPGSESASPASMNLPSRILQKFPFLVEMFYWALNYLAYSMTKHVGNALYSRYDGNEVTELAQQHGMDVLNLEHSTLFSIFFPVSEVDFQQFFLRDHTHILTLFNQIYSLVHIPGTVAYVGPGQKLPTLLLTCVSFLSWYYYKAPSHEIFALARRTMTLGNFAAFTVFSLYPCMPPRLLPESFGFRDTVRQEHAESVWVSGKDVNLLAAMPSLHFTYASIIGCTFFYQSGLFTACCRPRGGRRPSFVASFAYIVAGIVYPMLVLSVIVATANHYYLDAVAATFVVAFSFACNRVWFLLLPLERLLCRLTRLRKPTPTTGKRQAAEQHPGRPGAFV